MGVKLVWGWSWYRDGVGMGWRWYGGGVGMGWSWYGVELVWG